MERLDIDWYVDKQSLGTRSVHINGERYEMEDKDAGMTHAILLLVDAVKELSAEVEMVAHQMS